VKKVFASIFVLMMSLLASGVSFADDKTIPRLQPDSNSMGTSSSYEELKGPNEKRSMDTTPIYFDMGTFKYKIPRNYIVSVLTDDPNDNEVWVTIKVTYPGFEPLTEKTKDCLSQPPLYLPKNCYPVTFWIRTGKKFGDKSKKLVINGKTITDVDEWHFNNKRDLFRSQTPKPGPAGFEMYETGRYSVQSETYRKKSALHTILIDCYVAGVMDKNGIEKQVIDINLRSCDNLHSPLPQGGDVSYRIQRKQLKDAEQIDTGIRKLLNSFIIKGEKQ